MKRGQQGRAEHNQRCPQNQSSQHTPEQDALLQLGGDGEIAKNQQKNEEVIDGERLFDQVTGDKLERLLRSLIRSVRPPEVPAFPNEQSKSERQDDPNRAPGPCLPHAHDMGTALENAKIEGKD